MKNFYVERMQFATLGEFRNLTDILSDDTVVTICGSGESGFFLALECQNLICLDADEPNCDECKMFSTLGELREMTQRLADDTSISICGSDDTGFLHIQDDRKLITLDYDALDDCYDIEAEDYKTEGEAYLNF